MHPTPNALSASAKSTCSSNFTEENLPGAGRVIGIFYDYVGRAVEKRANRVAEKFGGGPQNSLKRILTISKKPSSLRLYELGSIHLDPHKLSRKEQIQVRKECKVLLGYVR